MTSMCSQGSYRVLLIVVRIVLRIMHPVIRVEGLENLPEEPAVICCNHSGILDPAWVLGWAKLPKLARTMAKKELFCNRFLTWFFTKVGAFPVDRGSTDISAIKNAMQTLKGGRSLLIFPEGTRIRKGKKSEPHSGAMLIASRMQVPIVPVYLSAKRPLFAPVTLKFGKAFSPQFAGSKPTGEELQEQSLAMMEGIYAMGGQE